MTTSQILSDFIAQERLKVTRDECNDPIIQGRFGHFDDNHDGRIGVVLMHDSAYWKNELKRQCGKDDPVVQLEGDNEAVFLATPKH